MSGLMLPSRVLPGGVVVVLLLFATAGCSKAPPPSGTSESSSEGDKSPGKGNVQPDPRAGAGSTATSPSQSPAANAAVPSAVQVVRSAADSFTVRWRTVPDPIPVSDPFEMDVEVFIDADCTTPLVGVTLGVDAAMPHHGHGMNVRPTVSEVDPGRFRVKGMLCHMPGRWEFMFDVTANGLLERAQTTVELK